MAVMRLGYFAPSGAPVSGTCTYGASSVYRQVVGFSTPMPAATTPTTTTTGRLPVTGADVLRVVALASFLLAAGAAIAFVGRRLQQADRPA